MMPFTTAKQHLFLQKEKAKQLIINYLAICNVRLIGLEPTRRETLDPKSSASTNFATGAILRCKGSDFLGASQIFRRLFTLFSRARVLYMVWAAPQKAFSIQSLLLLACLIYHYSRSSFPRAFTSPTAFGRIQ